jgi:hypothetical protein
MPLPTCQLLVVLHQLGLIAHLVGAVEKDAGLQRTARPMDGGEGLGESEEGG